MEASWGLMGASGASSSWGHLGGKASKYQLVLTLFGSLWALLGFSWAVLGSSQGRLGSRVGALPAVLRRSWGSIGQS
eukprot:7448537-Pyramimonas_sp.AAC.1